MEDICARRHVRQRKAAIRVNLRGMLPGHGHVQRRIARQQRDHRSGQPTGARHLAANFDHRNASHAEVDAIAAFANSTGGEVNGSGVGKVGDPGSEQRHVSGANARLRHRAGSVGLGRNDVLAGSDVKDAVLALIVRATAALRGKRSLAILAHRRPPKALNADPGQGLPVRIDHATRNEGLFGELDRDTFQGLARDEGKGRNSGRSGQIAATAGANAIAAGREHRTESAVGIGAQDGRRSVGDSIGRHHRGIVKVAAHHAAPGTNAHHYGDRRQRDAGFADGFARGGVDHAALDHARRQRRGLRKCINSEDERTAESHSLYGNAPQSGA